MGCFVKGGVWEVLFVLVLVQVQEGGGGGWTVWCGGLAEVGESSWVPSGLSGLLNY